MTAPLTPADCDLRGFPFMPLDVSRLMDSDTFILSTGDEFKAAMALWARAWHQIPAGSLPDNSKLLADLSRAGRKWPKVRDVALRGFIKCDDGRLYHPVIAAKALEALKFRRGQRDRALLRWQSHGNATASAANDATAMPRHAAANATAMPKTGTGTVKTTPNPPTTSSSSPPSDAAALPRHAPVSHGTRLPEAWTLPSPWYAFARHECPAWTNADVERIAASFADFWHGKPGQAGRKSDWLATWRNWIRREADKQRSNVNGRRSHRDDVRAKAVDDILGAVSYGQTETPDPVDSPRDVTGESERLDP